MRYNSTHAHYAGYIYEMTMTAIFYFSELYNSCLWGLEYFIAPMRYEMIEGFIKLSFLE
jgi:hypothetical protein